jgi:hypothetical protein
VLGSLPLLSFRVGAVQVLDNVTRRFSFKVSLLFTPVLRLRERLSCVSRRTMRELTGGTPQAEGSSSGQSARTY